MKKENRRKKEVQKYMKQYKHKATEREFNYFL